MPDATRDALARLWSALEGPPGQAEALRVEGEGALPSAFAVSDLAAATLGAACLAVAELVAARHGTRPAASVDRRLASFWFGTSVRPHGWASPAWDAVAGDYAAADGWVRLHTNAPHHRAAALAVLGAPAGARGGSRAPCAAGRRRRWRRRWSRRGGCAAAMRDAAAWARAPAGPRGGGRAAGLATASAARPRPRPAGRALPGRPLAGLRVLDLTRVLAGPVSTRFLAGFGAEVLRIDPPDWDEPARGARRDPGQALRPPGPAPRRRTAPRLERLLARADVLVHGYRPGALEGLGLGEARRREPAPRPGGVSRSTPTAGPGPGRGGAASTAWCR